MIQKLIEKIQKTKAPICVGLDPMLNYIPEHILKKSFGEFGETLEGAADAIWNFNKEIVDHTWDLIPSVKPQIAMYEALGPAGVDIYTMTCEYAAQQGLYVLGDIKRGDILAVPVTGAYGRTMASNYNQALIPSVVGVGEAGAHVMIRRQTIDDLLSWDVSE